MSATQAKFTGSIPENYDRYLGSLLFEFSAADMAQRVAKPIKGVGSYPSHRVISCTAASKSAGAMTRTAASPVKRGPVVCATFASSNSCSISGVSRR